MCNSRTLYRHNLSMFLLDKGSKLKATTSEYVSQSNYIWDLQLTHQHSRRLGYSNYICLSWKYPGLRIIVERVGVEEEAEIGEDGIKRGVFVEQIKGTQDLHSSLQQN